MQQLLSAIGETWAASGHTNLRDIILGITVTEHWPMGGGVPAHLAADHDVALAGITISVNLREALQQWSSLLRWSEGNLRMPDSFKGRYSYVELAGPKGMLFNDTVSFGLYLQQANTVYPSHWHEAVEHYLVLSGTADWQMDDAAHAPRKPGEVFVHGSNQRHATTTTGEPLLALWFWQGNIADSTYRIACVDA